MDVNNDEMPDITGNYDMDDITEKSPDSRFLKFKDVIGAGAFKKVYLAYDTSNGIEVIWNDIDISKLPDYSVKRISLEVDILKSCDNCEYIIKFYDYWKDEKNNKMIFITERATSGNLKEFILRVKKIKLKVIKKWCKQILTGIKYLHDNNIIHRDIKCDNIFINGHTGNVLIGDFGLARKVCNTDKKANTILGTPEFMAPEIYKEHYDKKIDVYSFGMCLFELITKEIPYAECDTIPQIWKNVTNKIKPESLVKIKNKNIKAIIEKCISNNEDDRPSIEDLLKYNFWDNDIDNENEVEDYMYSTKEMENIKKKKTDSVENTVDHIMNKTEEKANQILEAVGKKADEIINNAKEEAKKIMENVHSNNNSTSDLNNNSDSDLDRMIEKELHKISTSPPK